MSNKPASASELLSRVWSAMAATWQTLLSMTFAIGLINFAASVLLRYIPAPLDLVADIAVTLFTTVLSCGVLNGTLSYVRRGIITFDHLTSMLPYAKQMICAYLWQCLFIFLWILPGLLCIFIGFAMMFTALDGAAIIGISTLAYALAKGADGLMMASTAFSLAGMVLMLWLGFRATLNYTLATCFIVDTPDMGGVAALEKSKQAMRGHRWRFVKMSIPVFVMTLIISIITDQLSGITSGVTRMLISSILHVVPQVMSLYIVPVLYEEALDTEQ